MKRPLSLHKAKGRKAVMTALTVLLLVAMLAVGIGANALKTALNSYIDATPEGLYTLSDAFLEEVRDVEEDITITFCSDPDVLLSNYSTRYVYIMAREIERAKSNVTVVTHNVAEDPTSVQEFRTTSTTKIDWNHVIVSCGKRYRSMLAESFWSADVTTDEYFAFNGEYRMATTMLSLTAIDRPVAYFTTGFGERVYDPTKPDDPENERYRAFWQLLLDEGLEVKTVDLSEEDVPEDCVLLVMNGPTEDYAGLPSDRYHVTNTPPIERIDRYLDRAGALMLFKDPETSLPALEEFLAEWGIAYANGETVKEPRAGVADDLLAEDARTRLIAVYPTSEKDALGHSLFSDVAGLATAPRMVVPNSGYLTSTWLEDTKYITTGVSAMTSTFLYSSEGAKAYNASGLTDEEGSYPLARVTTRVYTDEIRDYHSYVFCAASTAMIETEYLDNPTYANYDVMFATVRTISRTDEYASDSLGGLNMNSEHYGGKHLHEDTLYETDQPVYEKGELVRTYYGLTKTAATVYTVLIMLPPLALLAFGTVRCVRRRNR